MLEHVSLNQERFRTPGLRADGRGIAVGERALLRFATLPQIVGFFRALSEEQSLDHILPTLKIIKARSQIQGLELLVDLPSQGSHMLDRVAAIARLLGGEVYTGRAPHFVQYRDAAAPFGYDVTRLTTSASGRILYADGGSMVFTEDGEIAFRGLLLSLSLTRKRGDARKGTLFVRVPPGLRNSMQRFLWQREIRAGLAELRRRAAGRFDQGDVFYLFRIEEFPPRLLSLFEGLPGVELYRTRRSNAFVQVGFEHPFALESCRKALDDDSLLFFSGDRDECDEVEGQPTFVDIDHLKSVDLTDRSLRPDREAAVLEEGMVPPTGWTSQQVDEALHYPVHLIRRASVGQGATMVYIATRIEIAWLKRLIYTLPETALEDYRMAVTNAGCIIINREGVELLPLGLRMREVFSDVFIPEGTTLSPPVGFEQLQRHLGLRSGYVTLMPKDFAHAFTVSEAHFRPIARYLLADVDFSDLHSTASAPLDVSEAVELVNRDVGYFALWGHNVTRIRTAEAVTDPTQPMKALPRAVEGQ